MHSATAKPLQNAPASAGANPDTSARWYLNRPKGITPSEWVIAGYMAHRLENTPQGCAPKLWPKDWQNVAALQGITVASVKRYWRSACDKLGICTTTTGKLTRITDWPTASRPTGKHIIITSADTEAAGYNMTRALILAAARLSRQYDSHPASSRKLAERTGTDLRTVTAAIEAAELQEIHRQHYDKPLAKPSAPAAKLAAKPSAPLLGQIQIRSKKNERTREKVSENESYQTAKPKPERIEHPLPEEWQPTADTTAQLAADGFTAAQITEAVITYRAHWATDGGVRSRQQWQALFVGWIQRRRHWKRLHAITARKRAGNRQSNPQALTDRSWAVGAIVDTTAAAKPQATAWHDIKTITTEQALADRSWAE